MATVTVNVQANTGDATNDVNQLDNALEGADKAAKDLSNSLEKQEARIKTLGGAINIVGGSVEVLAGGLALTGALSEEQAEQFQTAAIGAIAFADGAKRVFEGYKELSEGIRAYGGAAKVARTAQAALNKTILANPYVAFAAAVAAVTIAVVALIRSQDDEEAQLKRLEIARERYNKQLSIEETNRLALVKASGADAVELAKEELKAAEDLLQAKNDAFVAAKIENQFSDETAEARLEAIDAEGKLKVAKQNLTNATNAQAGADRQAAIEARNLRLEREGQLQVLEQLTEEIVESLGILGSNNPLDEPLETLEEINEEIENIIFFTKEQLDEFNKATAINEDQNFEARRKRVAAYYDDLIQQASSNASQVEQLERAKNKSLDQLDQERRDNIEAAASATLSTTIGLLATIRETTEDGSKEGFEKSKKFRIAETRLSSIQAAFDAYKSLVGVPYVGPILGVAAAGAALAAGQKAINDIQSSTFDGGGGLSNPAAGGAVGAGGGIPSGQQAGPVINRTIVGGTIEDKPIRAYVVGGDVADELAASEALQRRRALGTG